MKVLDVGQCNADHGAIRRLIESRFGATVERAHRLDDALAALRGGGHALVLVNRVLDADGSEGLDIVRALKADEALAQVPVMLVTNYSEHDQAAVALGAQPGFGKAQLSSAATLDKLARFLAD